jgi:hypothetical protein
MRERKNAVADQNLEEKSIGVKGESAGDAN